MLKSDWEAWRPLLVRAASARLKHPADAEDAAQRVLAKLSADGGRLLNARDPRAPLEAWLALLALREARDLARSEGRARARALRAATPEAELPSPLARLVQAEDAEALRKALSTLPARDRMLLRMLYWEGFSYAEAAKVLGASEGSISPFLQRAREALKSELWRTDPARGGVSPS